MSTQYLNDGTVAANRIASGFRGIDARRRRFALNPGFFMPVLDPRESGRQEHILPSGLVTFRTATIRDDDFEHALKNGMNPSAQSQQAMVEIPAATFLSNALVRFGEMGMRELSCLTMMDDPQPNEKGNITKEQWLKSAQGYFAALWPSFADLGHQCPHELQECVTCRLWLIGDPSADESMHEGLVERTSRLADQGKVAELRTEIYDVLMAYKGWLDSRWASLVGEMSDRRAGTAPGIAKLGPGEHHIRRNLHEIEPSEAATAAGFGAEVAAGQQEGFRELAAAMRESKGGGNSDLLKMMIERQNKTDNALASLAESIKALVDKQSGS